MVGYGYFLELPNDSFSRLTTRMIVHDSFSVSCFDNHWSDSSQKTCCRLLLSQKIHDFTSLAYGTPFSIHIFIWKEQGSHAPRKSLRVLEFENQNSRP